MRRWSIVGSLAALGLAAGCSGANVSDVLAPLAADAGTTGSFGVDAAACEPEAEPNDDKATANALLTSRCGVLDPTSELDYLTFTLKSSSSSVAITFEGTVRLHVEVAGAPSVDLTPSKNGALPFVTGKPYTIQIRNEGGTGKVAWRVNLTES